VSDLSIAAQQVVVAHLGVSGTDHVLVVTDEERRDIGMALYEAAKGQAAEAFYMEMIERETHGSEVPRAVAEAMAAADVVIAPTTKSLSHTKARRDACDGGTRVASMPKVTKDMMARALLADVETLKRLGRAYADALTAGSTARVISKGGSDCTFDISGREGISDDGDLTAPGAFGNLPAGEAFVAPVEGTANGILVYDGSLSPDEATETPVVTEIKDGRVVKIEGGPAPGYSELGNKYGDEAYEIAELGIGTNDKAMITGNMLEDEKVASTVHVAVGNNSTIGGVTTVASHHDGVIKDASLEIDGKLVLDEGKLLLG
jgi:leucyl aminopeptidase (aminopeptidase T)